MFVRNEFIKDKLEKIVNNQDENGLDNIDKNLLNISYIRAEERCILFNYEINGFFPNTKLKLEKISFSLFAMKMWPFQFFFRYSFIKSKHSKTPTVVMGEPCFENPCSYEAVEKVCKSCTDIFINQLVHHYMHLFKFIKNLYGLRFLITFGKRRRWVRIENGQWLDVMACHILWHQDSSVRRILKYILMV